MKYDGSVIRLSTIRLHTQVLLYLLQFGQLDIVSHTIPNRVSQSVLDKLHHQEFRLIVQWLSKRIHYTYILSRIT